MLFAIPDHPWVDSADGAAVRIAMTVGAAGDRLGVLQTATAEREGVSDAVDVCFDQRTGKLFADLRMGANVAAALSLRANSGVSGMGVVLHGAGFILSPEQADRIRPYGPATVVPYQRAGEAARR